MSVTAAQAIANYQSIAAVATSVSGTEGVAISGATVATFTDANPNATASDFTATINWGDGASTAGTVVAQTTGGFAVDGTHTYADEGKYTVGVSITDLGGSTASATSNANIADAALIAQSPGLILGDSYRVLNPQTITVATFTDANPNATASDFTATINWGDGTSTSGTVLAQNGGGFAVEGGHVYAADGRLQLGHPVPLFEIDVAIHDIGGSNASASSTATTIPAVTVAEAIANYQSDPNIAPQVVVDSVANVTANLGGLDTLASANDIVSITLTDGLRDPDFGFATIAGNGLIPGIITTQLLEALFNGGAAVVLGDGALTYHRADTEIDNSGDVIDFSSGAFQNLVLNGAFIEGGVVITGPGGIINSPGGPDASLANVLDNVTVSGGLTLEPGNSLELGRGTVSGAVTVDSSAYLFLSGDYTVANLTLNGGNLDGGVSAPFSGVRQIIPPDGLMQGYGEIGGSPLSGFMSLENEGTINSDINGQLLAINNINFANDGLVEATNGGKMDLAGPVTGDGQFLIGQAATLEFGGPTTEVVTFEFGGGGGTLYLDKATDFSGTVTGLAQADSIDLADFAFSSHPVITNVSGTGATGSTTDVTIADGSLTTTLELLNQYAGEYPIASTAYHLESDHPGSPDAGTLFTTIANPPLTAVGTNITGTEGSTTGTIPVATFTDANPNATASDFSASINWGDGTTTTGAVVAQSGGGFAVDGAHTYSDEGKYTVSTTIKDVGGSTASATSNANIADAALSAVSVGGQPQTLFQSVPDLFSTPPNSDFVDDVAGNQQMFDTFTLGNNSSVTSITFDVSNLAQFFPNWTSEPLTLAIYNIAPGGGPGTKLFSATFTPDADAHINFNLSFATALVTYDAHLALNPGTYLITYYNQDGLGAMGFVNGGSDQAFAEHLSTGTISPVNESLGFSLNGEVVTTGTTITGTEGTAISGATVANFTDANPNAPASDFTATIDWGDGTSTSGTVVAQNGGGFAVDGTHTYADEGKYAISTTI